MHSVVEDVPLVKVEQLGPDIYYRAASKLEATTQEYRSGLFPVSNTCEIFQTSLSGNYLWRLPSTS